MRSFDRRSHRQHAPGDTNIVAAQFDNGQLSSVNYSST